MVDMTQFEGLADEEKLNAHPETRAQLEAISDPESRFEAAAELANKHYKNNKDMDRLRDQRRKGMGVLHLTFNWPKAKIQRELGAKDRRMLTTALDVLDDRTLPKWTEATALRKAKAAHEELELREAIATTAREVRRVLIIELTGGRYGKVWQNTDLARISGLTSAAIAQIRTGKVNPPKSEIRARRAARKAAAQAQGEDGTNLPVAV